MDMNQEPFKVLRAVNYGTTFEDMESVTTDFIEGWAGFDLRTVLKALRILIDSKYVMVLGDDEAQTFKLTAKGRKWVHGS